MARRILICGSRDWDDVAVIRAAFEELQIGKGDTVIQGGSRGADAIAATVARMRGATVETYPADWRQNGRAAGPIRNILMLNTQPSIVIAFWKNQSRGTAHVLHEAAARKIPTRRWEIRSDRHRDPA